MDNQKIIKIKKLFNQLTDLLYILAVILILCQSFYMYKVYKNPCGYCYINSPIYKGKASDMPKSEDSYFILSSLNFSNNSSLFHEIDKKEGLKNEKEKE